MTNCKLLKALGGGGGGGNGALAAISTAKADRGSRKRLSRMDGPTALWRSHETATQILIFLWMAGAGAARERSMEFGMKLETADFTQGRERQSISF